MLSQQRCIGLSDKFGSSSTATRCDGLVDASLSAEFVQQFCPPHSASSRPAYRAYKHATQACVEAFARLTIHSDAPSLPSLWLHAYASIVRAIEKRINFQTRFVAIACRDQGHAAFLDTLDTMRQHCHDTLEAMLLAEACVAEENKKKQQQQEQQRYHTLKGKEKKKKEEMRQSRLADEEEQQSAVHAAAYARAAKKRLHDEMEQQLQQLMADEQEQTKQRDGLLQKMSDLLDDQLVEHLKQMYKSLSWRYHLEDHGRLPTLLFITQWLNRVVIAPRSQNRQLRLSNHAVQALDDVRSLLQVASAYAVREEPVQVPFREPLQAMVMSLLRSSNLTTEDVALLLEQAVAASEEHVAEYQRQLDAQDAILEQRKLYFAVFCVGECTPICTTREQARTMCSLFDEQCGQFWTQYLIWEEMLTNFPEHMAQFLECPMYRIQSTRRVDAQMLLHTDMICDFLRTKHRLRGTQFDTLRQPQWNADWREGSYTPPNMHVKLVCACESSTCRKELTISSQPLIPLFPAHRLPRWMVQDAISHTFDLKPTLKAQLLAKCPQIQHIRVMPAASAYPCALSSLPSKWVIHLTLANVRDCLSVHQRLRKLFPTIFPLCQLSYPDMDRTASTAAAAAAASFSRA